MKTPRSNPLPSTMKHRRRFLQGVGALMALPAMESFSGSLKSLQAATETAVAATSQTASPLRMAFITFPNGVNYSHWRPTGTGHEMQLNKTFASLEPLKDKFQVFTGFAQNNAAALGDGAGDHARANAAFLTGVHPLKTAGANIQNGVSVDQVAAQQIGHLTRIPSLQLSCEESRNSGFCDNGYSCAYQYNLSWASSDLPIAPESNPRNVFEQLFGRGKPGERSELLKKRLEERKSILDFVMQDARQMSKQISHADRQKMDQYFTNVREIEQQIEHAERFPLPISSMTAPSGIPQSYQQHIDIMFDLLAVAFETDSTRIASFALAHEGSTRNFLELGISEGHHYLSHHGEDPYKLELYAKIDRFYADRLAYLLRKLEQTKDPWGKSVLDQSMIVYGCAIGDGNKHNHNDLPIVVAGGAGGTFQPGRHVKFNNDVPLTNLYLTMLDRYGIQLDRLGDSTGLVTNV